MSEVRPDQLAKFEEIVANVLWSRQQFFSRFFERDNINKECKYPETESLDPEFYRDLFDREPIANRVVSILPMETWQVQPEIIENDSNADEDKTEFEKAWDELGSNLQIGKSYCKDEQGSIIWEYLRRLDIMSGIGQFGVMLLGIDDGRNLQEPVSGVIQLDTGGSPLGSLGTPERTSVDSPIIGAPIAGTETMYAPGVAVPPGSALAGTDQQYFGVQFGPSEVMSEKPSTEKHKLIFMRIFDESLVQVVRYEWSVVNPRFGMPVMYRITLNDPRQPHSGVGLPLATVYVHWTRVIHFADNLASSEIFGVPRLRPVLNPVLDIRKVRGASGEGYWQSCFAGISFETQPQLGGKPSINRAKMQDMVEDYMEGLKRYLVLSGMTAKTLAPSALDPTPFVSTNMEAIAIQMNMPIRVFKGSERGDQAAADYDDADWNDVLRARQMYVLNPRMIVPFIDRLILMGVLPEPTQFSARWPEIDNKTESQKASIALHKTQAIAAYIAGDCTQLIPPLEYLVRFLGYDKDVASAILEEAMSQTEDDMLKAPDEEGEAA